MRSKSKQSLSAAVLKKTSASSVTGGIPGKYVQSYVRKTTYAKLQTK